MGNPFVGLWRLFAFETPLELTSAASPAEVALRLSNLTALPRSLGRMQRKKALRGHVSAVGGDLRWALNEYRFASPRVLDFRLGESENGTTVRGEFRTWLSLRAVALGWFGCGVIVNLEQAVAGLIIHAGARAIGKNLLFILIGFAMAYGYVWLVVRIGRSRDRMLIKVIRQTLAGSEAAEAVRDLLSTDDSTRKLE